MDEKFAIQSYSVSKHFGAFRALKDISIGVPIGEVYGFIGKNGAGKTTFMRIACGLMKPSGGSIETKKQIGFLPQNVRFRDHLSGEEALKLFANLRHVGFEESMRFAKELEINLSKRADYMSPGQQRKLQLVIATVGFPDVLILDEPTAGLDPSGVQQVRMIIRQLQQRGCTVFLSSHVLMELENLCDTIAVIDHGELLYQGACGFAFEIETGGFNDETASVLKDSFDGAITLEADMLFARVQRDRVPDVLQFLYQSGIQVFGVKKQGIESLYNSLIKESA